MTNWVNLSFYVQLLSSIVALLALLVGAAPATAHESHLLAIYVLAFDNNPTSTANLTPQYQPTIQALLAATVGQPDKTALVLADLDGAGDTFILVIQNGQATPIVGLPNADGNLETTLTEYDMSDGATLGGFIKWSRLTYPSEKTVLVYVGHGAPLVPKTDLSNLFSLEAADTINPLPHHRGLNSNYTDYHPLSIISPYDLAYALKIGTDDGQSPLTVLDMIHCFSATIEQFYELYPYAETMTGSPNYTYMAPTMLGQALTNLQASMSAATMAKTIIHTYDEVLPATEHPRIFVAIDSHQLAAVKHAWDITAYHLQQQFVRDAAVTKNKISSAYNASAKYDTTFCEPQDWTLATPDALSDMVDFADKLTARFGAFSEVGVAATMTKQHLQKAILAKVVQNGEPWFAEVSPKPTWLFQGAGVALYTDFKALFTTDGVNYLSQQATWYTNTVTPINPQPYAFIQNGYQGTTWANVLAEFWDGQIIKTAPCLLPAFPQAQDEGEISVAEITFPIESMSGLVSVDAPLSPSVAFNTAGTVDNPLIQFTIWQSDSVVYSDTVSAGYLITGTHEVRAATSWLPQTSGSFKLQVEVDSDNRIMEQNEADNIETLTAEVLPEQARPMLTGQVSQNWQWAVNPSILLELAPKNATVSSVFPTSYLVQISQYQADTLPFAQVPRQVYEGKVSVNETLANQSIRLALPNSLKPGPVFLKIWAVSAVGALSVDPVDLTFNAIPTNTPLNSGKEHYFLFEAKSGDIIKINLDVPDNEDANMFVWLPFKYGAPTWQAINLGDDSLTLNPIPYSGQYLLSVRGETNTHYSLTVWKNGHLEGEAISPSQKVYLPIIMDFGF